MSKLIIEIIEVAVWSGIAAIGFGILFNIPKRAIFTVFILGLVAGFVKFVLLHFQVHIVFSSLIAALIVGVLSMPLSHKIHQPPVIFSIPAIIPMIPGYFAYETVLAVMNFTFMETDLGKKSELINTIFTNGFTMFFILISLTIGVSFPMLLMRKKSLINKYD